MKAGCAHVYRTHGALKSQNSIKSSQLKDLILVCLCQLKTCCTGHKLTQKTFHQM